MSRGPGIWQRGILAAVEQHGAVYLRDLLPRPTRRAEYVALHRGAVSLCKQGRIDITAYMCGSGPTGLTGADKIVLTRPGMRISDRSSITRISVDSVPGRNPVNA